MENPSKSRTSPLFPPLWSALGQLQFDLDGVPALTDEERVLAWLADQEHETADTFRAMLFVRDNLGRAARAERWMELRTVQAPFDREHWLIPGGSEAVWLYEEASVRSSTACTWRRCSAHTRPVSGSLGMFAGVRR